LPKEWITDVPSEFYPLSVLMEAEHAKESEKTGYGTNPVSSPARGIHLL